MTCYFFLITTDNVVHRMELVKFQHSIQIFTNNLAENSTNQICFSIREKLVFFFLVIFESSLSNLDCSLSDDVYRSNYHGRAESTQQT